MIQNHSDELWDIYTKDRAATGEMHQRRNRMKAGEYHIVVHICIFNHKNQLLIQQRQPFKKGWPNMWDLSVGGSALAGESSSEAAARETAEELGIHIDFSEMRPHFTINFAEGFDDYFIVEQEIDLSTLILQQEEVRQVRWAGKEDVLRMQEEGTMVPYWFLDRLFEIRGAYDAHGRNNAGITIACASRKNLASWMSMIEIVKRDFPGFETPEKLQAYRNTVIRHISRGSAICALYKNMVVGILLFSPRHNRLCHLAVHPEFRRRHIATRMVNLMFRSLAPSPEIRAKAYPGEDERGIASRAFYQSLGFVPAKSVSHDGCCREQEFVRNSTALPTV